MKYLSMKHSYFVIKEQFLYSNLTKWQKIVFTWLSVQLTRMLFLSIVWACLLKMSSSYPSSVSVDWKLDRTSMQVSVMSFSIIQKTMMYFTNIQNVRIVLYNTLQKYSLCVCEHADHGLLKIKILKLEIWIMYEISNSDAIVKFSARVKVLILEWIECNSLHNPFHPPVPRHGVGKWMLNVCAFLIVLQHCWCATFPTGFYFKFINQFLVLDITCKWWNEAKSDQICSGNCEAILFSMFV